MMDWCHEFLQYLCPWITLNVKHLTDNVLLDDYECVKRYFIGKITSLQAVQQECAPLHNLGGEGHR